LAGYPPRHPILSQPIRLHWAGWETTTLKLQQNGWDLSASEEPYDGSMAIAFRHESSRVRGMSRMEQFNYHQSWHDMEYARHISLPCQIGDFGVFQIPLDMGQAPYSFAAIDARPQRFDSYMGKPMPKGRNAEAFDEWCHFAKVGQRQARQIIVQDESIDELLDKIMKKQEPDKQRYFEEKVRREANAGPVPILQAQILSFPQRSAA
jgi:hypothetical protein